MAMRIWPAWIFTSAPGFVMKSTSGYDYNTLVVNETVKPFDNVKVRQALYYAVDKESVAKVFCAGVPCEIEEIHPIHLLTMHRQRLRDRKHGTADEVAEERSNRRE